jgi:2-polyprenyl-3-methyl-5-hydroxy-6-metoxy-1,4-benzoquinol methylase
MKILVCPALKAAAGSGHLRRSLAILPELGDEAELLCDEPDGGGREAMLRASGLAPGSPRVRRSVAAGEAWDLIVLDRRETAAEDIRRLAAHGCLLGLDEGGGGRARLPFLVDTLPGHSPKHPPNVRALQLPVHPGARRGGGNLVFRNALISFGGEDAGHLSERLLDLLLSGAVSGLDRLTVVEGPLFGPRSWPEGVRVWRSPPRLVEQLSGFDLVFCSFGLTCFEALAAGVPVILLNPTAAHRRLSRRLGLPEIGVVSPRAAKLRRLLADPERFRPVLDRAANLFAAPQERLPVLLGSLVPPRRTRCPLCGGGPDPALARFPRRTYVRCRACGLVYLLSFAPRRDDYDGEYFFSEYCRRYGRTYLEDFQEIKRRAAARLELIRPRLGGAEKRAPRLLDVGCAYGAFLQAAHEAGFRAVGLDLGRESSRHVRDKLGLECLHADFEQTTQLAPGSFDVVTMWFVIEHFQNTAAVLEKVAGLLRPGGVFAFATPNGAGVSARKNRSGFLDASPEDHYSLWYPSRVRKQLQRFGFKVVAIRVTGHHPERFPLPASLNSKAGPLLAAASRLLGLGDTFEVYALKTGDKGCGDAGRKS